LGNQFLDKFNDGSESIDGEANDVRGRPFRSLGNHLIALESLLVLIVGHFFMR